MSVAFAAQADIASYMSVFEGQNTYVATFTNLSTVVGTGGTGEATIDSYAWSDGSLWYYSYQILNNDQTTPGVNNFGWNSCTPNASEGIYNFSVTLTNAPGGVNYLEMTGFASSTGGGGSWAGTTNINVFPEEFIEGAQWYVNASNGEPIAPTQWKDIKNGPGVIWAIDDSGD